MPRCVTIVRAFVCGLTRYVFLSLECSELAQSAERKVQSCKVLQPPCLPIGNNTHLDQRQKVVRVHVHQDETA